MHKKQKVHVASTNQLGLNLTHCVAVTLYSLFAKNGFSLLETCALVLINAMFKEYLVLEKL